MQVYTYIHTYGTYIVWIDVFIVGDMGAVRASGAVEKKGQGQVHLQYIQTCAYMTVYVCTFMYIYVYVYMYKGEYIYLLCGRQNV